MNIRTLLLATAWFLPLALTEASAQLRESPGVEQPALSARQAVERYELGERLEHGKDLREALVAYTEAGEAGNGLAQKKLGDIYNNGNAVVVRDYETALKWYEKARAQGIQIAVPRDLPTDLNQPIRLR